MTGQKRLPQPRRLRPEDVDRVVRVHQACFAGFLVTELGPAFLRHFFMQTLGDPETVVCVLAEPTEGKPVGYALATWNPSFYGRIVQRGPLVSVVGALAGLFRSRAVRRGLVRGLTRVTRLFRARGVRGSAEAGLPPANGPVARFLFVGLDPQWRGSGNAERLVRFFAQEVFAAGAARIGGIVMADNLASVILFKRLEWGLRRRNDRVYTWLDA